VCIIDCLIWLIGIPDPLATCTWSEPPYFSHIMSLSSSEMMWPVAPVSVYHSVSTLYPVHVAFATFSSP
jgi:hypothetical protein